MLDMLPKTARSFAMIRAPSICQCCACVGWKLSVRGWCDACEADYRRLQPLWRRAMTLIKNAFLPIG
jgi:hypothetical protein